MYSFHTRENRGFDTVKSTQKYVHSSSVRNVSSDLPCYQPYVLVCCDGEFGCDWDGDVSLIFSACVSSPSLTRLRALQFPGIRAADVLHEDWETIQGVTYYDYSCIRTYSILP